MLGSRHLPLGVFKIAPETAQNGPSAPSRLSLKVTHASSCAPSLGESRRMLASVETVAFGLEYFQMYE